jgi:hypothetical protein
MRASARFAASESTGITFGSSSTWPKEDGPKAPDSRTRTARAKHWFGPNGKGSKGNGHPIMFGCDEALHFGPFREGGGYPKRFLRFAFATLKVTDPSKVLHLGSGSMRTGTRVDIRRCCRPTVIADVRHLPLKDETFPWIMADPPYDKTYAQNLYGTGRVYPKPGEILREAARVLSVGGRVGLLHFLVPMVRRPLRIVKVYGITTGCGYAIRAWTVLEKVAECGPRRLYRRAQRARRSSSRAEQ